MKIHFYPAGIGKSVGRMLKYLPRKQIDKGRGNEMPQDISHVPTFRAIHIDLKGMPPRMERLLQLLELFADAGYNALLIEWEDMFPWREEIFRRAEAYTVKEIQILAKRAADLDLEIIPLVQSFGHMENVLRHRKYASFRELDWLNSDLFPSSESRKLVTDMIDEMLEVLPQVRYLHLGGDEVGSLGLGRSRNLPESAKGKEYLYLSHMKAIAHHLQRKGIRPIIWSDMLRGMSSLALKEYAAVFDFAVWGSADLDRQAELILDAGGKIWGAPCFKGADGITSDLPDLGARRKVTDAYLELGKKYQLTGLIACGWSRYSTLRSQCEPLEGALDSAVITGILFSGNVPEQDRISGILKKNGFYQDHQRSKELLESLTLLRKRCRHYLFDALELAASQERLGVSEDSKSAWYSLMENHCLEEYILLKKEFHRHFDRFIPETLVEDYLEERFIPFRRGLELMREDCRKHGHPDAEKGYREIFGY